MDGIVTTLSTNLFRAFLIKKFMSIFFQTDAVDKRKEKVVYFLFFSLTILVYLLFYSPPANIITNVLLIYLITQIYEGGQKKKVLVSLLVYGINMFCDIITVYSFSNYIAGKGTNEMTVYITVFLISICEFVIERFLVKNKAINYIPPHWNILITIPFISIVLLLILIMNNLNNRVILVSVSTGILFINLLIFYLYDILVDAYLKLEERTLFERQVAGYSNQLNIMMQSEENVRSMRHDMKHHLNELLIMAKRNNTKEVEEYIQKMYKQLEIPYEYISSGNQEIDSLMNYMLHKAEKCLKKVNYEINVPNELVIQSFDLNVIIGNLLENAIEAAINSQEKWLEVFLSYEQGILFIRVRNSYINVVQKQEGIYITTKKEIQEHGIGLQNVKKVVENYKGDMHITDSDNIFDVKIILYSLVMR